MASRMVQFKYLKLTDEMKDSTMIIYTISDMKTKRIHINSN